MSDNEDFSYPEFKSKVKKILVHTKADLKKSLSENIHNISVKKDIGINDLIKKIFNHLNLMTPKESALLTQKRHVNAVEKAIKALNDLLLIDINISPELASEDLRIVAKEIGKITNVIDVEDILDDIFTDFVLVNER